MITASVHCVYLCLNYFDYANFKKNHTIVNEIDAIILDIRLNNGDHVDLDLAIPEPYSNTEEFHKNAGFYIFNDLIHLGVPAEKMCFMTGEDSTFGDFKAKCLEIYVPQMKCFEKRDKKGKKGYDELRAWLQEQESDYVQLRRGIIEGCRFLKNHIEIEKDDDNIQFRDFVKKEDNKPTIEIPTTDIENYLDVVSQLLAIKEPIDQNIQYRLFLRTLVHEWEENIHPKNLKEKYPQFFTKDQPNSFRKMNDIYTFAWLMKMTRNWVSHANLLEPLNSQIIAFLFLINMRAMFKLPKAIQPYERILLRCISLSPATAINSQKLDSHIIHTVQNIDDILTPLKINEQGHFGEKINAIYRRNTGNPDAEEHNFKSFLLQYFWVNQNSESELRKLLATSDDFLPTLARHIYKDSFL
jgi:hypothetical protein